MAPKIKIIQNLHERLRLLKSSTSGVLYGLTGASSATLLCCVVDASPSPCAPHLLPAPLAPLASLRDGGEGANKVQYKVEVENREVLVTTRTGRELDYEVISQEDFEKSVCAARVHFRLQVPEGAADCGQVMLEACEGASSFVDSKSGKLICGDSAGADAKDDALVQSLLEENTEVGYSSVPDIKFELHVGGKSSLEKKDSEGSDSVIEGEVVAYLERGSALSQAGAVLQRAMEGVIRQTCHWRSNGAKGGLETVTVLPYRTGHLFTVVYPKAMDEDSLTDYRKSLNESFLLPTNAPFFCRRNAFVFSSDKSEPRLWNPHAGLRNPAPESLVAVTRGRLTYHHYMQDDFDDNQWGCAYRSLQTIVSWFRHQGYTSLAIPSHRAIQAALVACGDKPANFVGSRDWIGSLEVGYVLQEYLGVTCKVLSVERGDEMYEKGRELLNHFQIQGTPVMIGGGVLAHTILGVTYDADSGDTRYLVLDPHYTGADEAQAVRRGGWCAWKTAKFWAKKAFYNLCLPQRPAMV